MPRRRNRTGKPGGQKHNQNTVMHGSYRADEQLVHDRRTKEARYLSQTETALINALGGDDGITPQEALIIKRASMKSLRCALAEAAMIRSNGNASESLQQDYLKWSQSLREDLKALGFKRRPKELSVTPLQWIEGKTE